MKMAYCVALLLILYLSSHCEHLHFKVDKKWLLGIL